MKTSKDFKIIPNITPLKPLWNKTVWKETQNIDDKRTYPFSEEFDDIFFQDDVIEETNYVFIEGNNLEERWRLEKYNEFKIGELGFGLGLNFFIVLKKWIENFKDSSNNLTFVSIDQYAPKISDIIKIKEAYPQLKEVIDIFLSLNPVLFHGNNNFYIDKYKVTLKLIISEINEGLKSIENIPSNKIDAWFLDGFDPKKNPDMWDAAIFKTISTLSNTQSTFSTYTAAGFVKRNLERYGFDVKKIKGFANKRHMLKGNFSYTSPSRHQRKIESSSDIAIIGSGLSSSILANKLACQGFKVDVYEKNKYIALGTSSNPWAAMYPKLALGDDSRSYFLTQSYFYAANFYKKYITSFKNNGVLFLSNSDARNEWIEKIIKLDRKDIFESQTKKTINKINGVDQNLDGLLVKHGGCLSPSAICKDLLKHPNISIHLNHDYQKYKHIRPGSILPIFSKINNEKQYSSLIVASGLDLKNYIPSINSMKGSIIGIKCNELSGIQHPINHSGYVLPQVNGITWLGSSYEKTKHLMSSEEIQESILSRASEVFKNIGSSKDIIEWSGIRSTLPDRMPLAGAMDNNVFVIGGLASRGLSFAPLLAEIIACEISGLSSPVSKKILASLSPNRFSKNST